MEEKTTTKALATYYASVDDRSDKAYKVEILEDGPVKKIAINGTIYEVDYNVGGDSIHSLILNNRSHGVQITGVGDSEYEVKNRGDLFRIRVIDELKKMRQSRPQPIVTGRQTITAQMPGIIHKVYVQPGQKVQTGDPLCVLEAMKMENEILSPIDGEIKEVFIKEGDKMTVNEKMIIVE
jgi:biotin carboxyl carrier protein